MSFTFKIFNVEELRVDVISVDPVLSREKYMRGHAFNTTCLQGTAALLRTIQGETYNCNDNPVGNK